MIISAFKALFSNMKLAASIAGVVMVVSIVFYGLNIINKNKQLEETNIELNQTVVSLQDELEEQKRIYDREMEAYSQTNQQYLEDLEKSKQRSQRFQDALNRTSNEYQQCINMRVPDDVIDSLR